MSSEMSHVHCTPQSLEVNDASFLQHEPPIVVRFFAALIDGEGSRKVLKK